MQVYGINLTVTIEEGKTPQEVISAIEDFYTSKKLGIFIKNGTWYKRVKTIDENFLPEEK